MRKLFHLFLIFALCWAVTTAYKATHNTQIALRKSKSFQELALTCAMDPQAKACDDPSLATAAGGRDAQ